jgi:hypothetical protein
MMAFQPLGKIKDLRMDISENIKLDDLIKQSTESTKEKRKVLDKQTDLSENEDLSQTSSTNSSEDEGSNFFLIGKHLAETMDELGYHPVIVFGSANSGKSTLLGSLFGYFQIATSKGISISLGEALIPSNTPHGKETYEEAQRFFYSQVQEFLDGTAHVKTRSERPFFIPVTIKPPNLPEVKFAFMESDGEWYQPQEGADKFYPELMLEINAILKFYQKGISFIHVAPFTQQRDALLENKDFIKENKKALNTANLALVGVLNSYEKLRIVKKDDKHMLLITKWDVFSKDDPLVGLENVDISELKQFATTVYRKGYTALNNLNINSDQREILPYCSGRMSGRDILVPPTELEPILNKYPETLWNWLYGNATELNSAIQRREILIPEPLPPKKTIIDFLGDLLTKIFH